MTKFTRLRTRSIAFAALLFASLGLLTSCTDEPLARATQASEELLLTPLIGRRNNPFIGENQSRSDSGAWQGTWILRGHMLALTPAHVQSGETENRGFLFGYSYRAKRFFMLTVFAGGSAPDSVGVSWFTIKDRIWRFMPEEVEVGGKAVERQIEWSEKEASAKPLTAPNNDDVAWTLPPARTEMAQFAGWTGRWPNKTMEVSNGQPATVEGEFDSRLVANGYFLVWFERNNIVLNFAKSVSDREVDIWGYSDVTHSYFRVIFVTGANGNYVRPTITSASFLSKRGDNGLLLASPLYKTQVGKDMLTSRYGISRFGDTLYLAEEYLVGGINWTTSPSRIAKWGRIKPPAPADPKVK